jgi:ABC-type transporter Mla maintaining outer membrane lipid asymmetry permease subunit MlaE
MAMGGPSLQAFWRQLDLIGVQSAGIVMLVAALAGGGFVLSLQATLPIGMGTTLELLATFMVRVLGVVFTLLVLAARSVTAICSDLAMRRASGLAAIRPLLPPRLLALVVSGFILYLYFVLTSLLVGALVSNGTFDVWEFGEIVGTLQPGLILVGMLRTGLLAAVALLVALRLSVRPVRRVEEVPGAVANGVFQAIVVMLVLELAYQLAAAVGHPLRNGAGG